MRSFFYVGLALACCSSQATTDAVTTQLPRGVVPTHYDIHITPDAAQRTFTATTQASIQVKQTTRRITLHAADLAFSRVDLHLDSGSLATLPLQTAKVRVDKKTQTATFEFAKPLPVGQYRLRMDYTGVIGTQANGLFALDYPSADGSKRGLYTQFENSDARRFIPSWDEPAFKTTFDLKATVPAQEMAVSNMPVAEKEDLGNGKVRVRFQTSPKMSTYLLFFALGDFERASVQHAGTDIGVITKKGSLAQADFVLAASKDILAEFNDYFGVPYPLPKLDNIAAPGQSQFFSAMENWGAIFTFEYALLLDPAFSSQADKQGAFSTAAHEIAHQWFGNLVTMQWWDDLWLNEGFASWMEGRTTQRLHPEWQTELRAVGGRDWAMGQDALKTTHPVVQHVATVEQASQAFDGITYQKGEAVVRMLEAYVGEDAWRTGVRAYMKKHAYGNTRSDDLWQAMDAAASVPVSRIAHDFTLQPGVPLVRVGAQKCVDGSSVATLQQGEFSKDQPHKKPLRWQVPVIAKSLVGGAEVRTLVRSGAAKLTVPGCEPVVVNAGQTGYYRTLYAPQDFQALAQSFTQLAPIDQLGLLADSWALGKSGLQPASDILDLAAATRPDANPQVWERIARVLVEIDGLYRAAEAANRTNAPSRRAQFTPFAIQTLAPVLQGLGWVPVRDEPTSAALLRNTLIGALSALGDAATITEARRRYQTSLTDPTTLPGEMRQTITAVVARHADTVTWDALHTLALQEKSPLVRDNLYSLLGSTEDAALAQRALDLALLPEPGATSSADMIDRVARLHPQLAFDFAVANMGALQDKIDTTSRARFYPNLAKRSADPQLVARLKAFTQAHIAAGSRQGAQAAMASMQDTIRVLRDRLPALDAWLAKHPL